MGTWETGCRELGNVRWRRPKTSKVFKRVGKSQSLTNIHYNQQCLNVLHYKIQNTLKLAGFLKYIFLKIHKSLKIKASIISKSLISVTVISRQTPENYSRIDMELDAGPSTHRLQPSVGPHQVRKRPLWNISIPHQGHSKCAGNVPYPHSQPFHSTRGIYLGNAEAGLGMLCIFSKFPYLQSRIHDMECTKLLLHSLVPSRSWIPVSWNYYL